MEKKMFLNAAFSYIDAKNDWEAQNISRLLAQIAQELQERFLSDLAELDKSANLKQVLEITRKLYKQRAKKRSTLFKIAQRNGEICEFVSREYEKQVIANQLYLLDLKGDFEADLVAILVPDFTENAHYKFTIANLAAPLVQEAQKIAQIYQNKQKHDRI